MRVINSFNRIRWSAIGAAVTIAVSASVALASAGATNTDGGGAGAVFVPITPCRLFDTRNASTVGPRSTPLANGETYTQPVTGANGDCIIPTSATAVSMNVTIVNPTATSFLTVWPADGAQPLASNLNWLAGGPATPNKVDVKLSADGKIKLFDNAGSVDVLADVVGYYADHNHDDRYYTKAQTDTAIAAAVAPKPVILQIPASAFQPTKGAELEFVHNCASSIKPEGTARLPIELPVGAQLVSVKVNVFDGGGAAIALPFTLDLNRYTLTIVGNSSPTTLVHFTGGALNANTSNVTLTPAITDQAIEGFTYDIDMTGFTFFTADGNAFCSAVVTYLPPS